MLEEGGEGGEGALSSSHCGEGIVEKERDEEI